MVCDDTRERLCKCVATRQYVASISGFSRDKRLQSRDPAGTCRTLHQLGACRPNMGMSWAVVHWRAARPSNQTGINEILVQLAVALIKGAVRCCHLDEGNSRCLFSACKLSLSAEDCRRESPDGAVLEHTESRSLLTPGNQLRGIRLEWVTPSSGSW